MEVRYDYSKLLGRLREKGYTQAQFAERLGMSEMSLNNKLNNKYDFKQSEIVAALSALDIPASKTGAYFFTHKL